MAAFDLPLHDWTYIVAVHATAFALIAVWFYCRYVRNHRRK